MAATDGSVTELPPSIAPNLVEQSQQEHAQVIEPAKAQIREDQVLNAVGFLSHPKVQGSPTAVKRSFLERKGLSTEEIDEAFRRVPETNVPAPDLSSSFPAASIANNNIQTQQAQPSPQIAAQQPPNQLTVSSPAPVKQGLRWTQVVLGVSAVAAGVYVLTSHVVPFAQSLYSRWSAATAAREAEMQKREQELKEAVGLLKQCETQLKTSSDNLAEVAALMREQLRSGSAAGHGSSSREYHPMSHEEQLRQELADARAALAVHGVYPPGPPRTNPYFPPRFTSPSPTMSFDSRPPVKMTAPGPSSSMSAASARGQPQPSREMDEPQYPPSFYEVMDMVSRNVTPPNVRTDIVDTPPDPTRPPTDPRSTSRPKPWEGWGDTGVSPPFARPEGSYTLASTPYSAANMPPSEPQAFYGNGSSSYSQSWHSGPGSAPFGAGYNQPKPTNPSPEAGFPAPPAAVNSPPSSSPPPVSYTGNAMPSRASSYQPHSVLPKEDNVVWQPPPPPRPTIPRDRPAPVSLESQGGAEGESSGTIPAVAHLIAEGRMDSPADDAPTTPRHEAEIVADAGVA